jgi:cell volume regulation protein A
VAILGRSAVLYPMLGGIGVSARDRRLIALLGPRGLSALLMALLPVFAGMPGAERLFAVTCLTVLVSVVLHGAGIVALLRREQRARSGSDRPAAPPPPATARVPESAPAAPPSDPLSLPVLDETARAEEDAPPRISVEEVRQMLERREPVVLVDVRADRSYRADPLQATGAIRLPPEDPVRAAEAVQLPRDATLALYCA